ncbi:MAG: helix-turn-helix transcriptional regulator [Patescibacteria group bacterium]|nr:helix-turn-helix transcriptional regulator [Patescibacteria group bacterium]
MKTRISEYRQKLGLTQEQLAQAVGVSRQTIIALEQGRYNPSLQLAYRVAKTLRQKRIEDVFSELD